jgi:ABC-2 type transport system ATP-binding protein
MESLVEIRVSGDLEALYNWIEASLDVELVDRMNNGVRVRVPETVNLSSLLRRLVLDGIEVSGFFKVERRLEDAFVDMLRTK